jgi:phosphorylase kinase alpha/beta subunit
LDCSQDSSRLHYELWELRVFENIECQWPLFYCYLIINGCFEKDAEAVELYSDKLEDVSGFQGDQSLVIKTM